MTDINRIRVLAGLQPLNEATKVGPFYPYTNIPRTKSLSFEQVFKYLTKPGAADILKCASKDMFWAPQEDGNPTGNAKMQQVWDKCFELTGTKNKHLKSIKKVKTIDDINIRENDETEEESRENNVGMYDGDFEQVYLDFYLYNVDGIMIVDAQIGGTGGHELVDYFVKKSDVQMLLSISR